jgi:hypothetical protein
LKIAADLNAETDTSAQQSFSRKDVIACLYLVALATIVMLPAFFKGFPAGYDALRHYRWTAQFADALRDGAIFPRWLPTANNHQGSPVALYYPPLPFYVGAAFGIFVNTLQAMALSCWLSLAISGITMYTFSRRMLPLGFSLFAAALYILIPYHLYDFYQGTAVSEFWSFAWIPLLFDSIHRLSEGGGKRNILFLALSYGLLLLTHVPIAFLTTLLLPIYALLLTREVSKLLRIGFGLLLGAGLSAIFVVPIVFERGYIRLQFKFDYQAYFLFENIQKAFQSTLFPPVQTPETYLLDTNVIAVALAVLFAASSLLIWQEWKLRHQDASRFRLFFAIWLTTGLSLLITTRSTALVWRLLPGLQMLFFPVRFFVIASAGVAFLAAATIWRLSPEKSWRLAYASALTAALIFNLVISYLVIVRSPHDAQLSQNGLLQREAREYRPVWWDTRMDTFDRHEAARLESGEALIRAIDDQGIKQSYEVSATKESIITFRPLYFPGWIAEVNGEPMALKPSDSGNLQLIIAPGKYQLDLKFEDTRPRTTGKMISALSILLFCILLFRFRTLQNPASNPPHS